MKKKKLDLIFLILLCAVLMFAEFIWGQQGTGGERASGGQQRKPVERGGATSSDSFIKRQEYVLANGIDRQYRLLSNPLPDDREQVQAGEKIFLSRCIGCHGVSGRGDGDQVEFIDSSPTDLTAEYRLRIPADAYMYWTLALGGGRFNSQMPRFKNTVGMPELKNPLKEEEIWQVVHYISQFRPLSSNREHIGQVDFKPQTGLNHPPDHAVGMPGPSGAYGQQPMDDPPPRGGNPSREGNP
ncbi:cytochrome c [bacterium]|nr:cytochrome c [bacterium]